MDNRASAWILAAVFLVSFAAGFRDPSATVRLRILLEKEEGGEPKHKQAAESNSPPPHIGGNPSPSTSGNVDPRAHVKSPPPEKPSIPPPAPDSPLNSTSPPKNISISTPSIPSPPQSATQPPPRNHSEVASPTPLASGAPPKRKNETISADEGNSKGNTSVNNECTPSVAVKCPVEGLIACLKNDSGELFLIIQNKGEIPLNLTVFEQEVQVAKHSAAKVKVNVSAKDEGIVKLKARNKTCTVAIAPPESTINFIDLFPHDMDHVTLLHGVYMATLSVILIGGVWGCCKLRKRRSGGSSRVAYQQLEMSSERPPDPLTNEDREDGWDEHWNDDWDEEEAKGRTGPRKSSSDRNDWEDWDD